MELEELKSLWQSQTDEPKFTGENLNQILSQKGGNVISRLQCSMVFEYYFTIVTLVISAFVLAFAQPEIIKAGAAVMLAICVVFVFVYRKQLQLLKSISPQGNSVKDELTSVLISFKKFLRLYRISYWALLPVALIIGFILGGQLTTGDDWFKVFHSPVLTAVIVFIIACVVIALNKAVAYYLDKLYGGHLKRLEEMLKQFEE